VLFTVFIDDLPVALKAEDLGVRVPCVKKKYLSGMFADDLVLLEVALASSDVPSGW
jgi:hypothetical protein